MGMSASVLGPGFRLENFVSYRNRRYAPEPYVIERRADDGLGWLCIDAEGARLIIDDEEIRDCLPRAAREGAVALRELAPLLERLPPAEEA